MRPPWNLDSTPILGNGLGSLSRYIIVNLQDPGQEPDVLRFWTWAPGDKILVLMRKIRQALCHAVPRGRVSGVSGILGLVGDRLEVSNWSKTTGLAQASNITGLIRR